MAKKNGIPFSRKRKMVKKHPCGCFYCCGLDPDTQYQLRKLKKRKNIPTKLKGVNNLEKLDRI